MDALLARGITPDIVTDQTTTDPDPGYIPRGMTAPEADELRGRDRDELIRRADATLIDHIRAMLEFQRRGAEVFEYGNGLRARAQLLGVSDAFDMGVFTERYIRPLFCQGIGPFRWLAISGDPEDIYAIDDIILEHFAGEPITHWIAAAREAVHFTGLPARIGWLGYGERRKLGLLVNDAVASGRIAARSRSRATTSTPARSPPPCARPSACATAPTAIADWPILNALLNTASHADLVAVHGFGGQAAVGGRRRPSPTAPRRPPSGSARSRQRPGDRRAAPRGRRLRGGGRGGRPGRAGARQRGGGRVPAGGSGMRVLDDAAVEAAVRGGSVLACGGGGWVDHGYLVGRTAVSYGTPYLATLDEIDPDALVVTVTAIGAPGAAAWEMRPQDYVRALQLLAAEVEEPVVATITAQNGSSTTCNGWVQSAVLGTLVLDAAGDGRAHPTGKMGSIGLTAEPGYVAVQSAAGGNRAEGRYLEVVVRGSVALCANVLREASDQSGGFIASARNPVSASYVREHAAVGAISLALELGESMVAAEDRGAEAVIDAIVERLGGTILARGAVHGKELRYDHAFDVGSLSVGDVELGYVNEYLTAESGGQRLASFPDVLTTLSLADGRPVAIKDVPDGGEVAILHADKSQIPIGDGVRDPSVYPEVEAMLGKALAEHALA